MVSDPDEELVLREVMAAHRASHERDGTTYAVFFPPECPWEVKERLTDEMTELAYGVEREGWDAYAFSQTGDCKLVPFDETAPASRAGELLAAVRAAHGREPRLGCQLAAHRDLGFCAACHPEGGDGELRGWRLLALAERGIPDQHG